MFRYRSFKNIGYNNSETPAVYSYETTEDTIAKVSVSGYFSDPRAEIREGDLIVARCTDGSTTLTALNSDSVVAMPAAADIAVKAQTLADAVAYAESGLPVNSVITTLEYNSGTGIGGNTYQKLDAGSAGARPAARQGLIIHVGADGLYLKAIEPKDGRYSGDQLGLTATSTASEIQAVLALGVPLRIESTIIKSSILLSNTSVDLELTGNIDIDYTDTPSGFTPIEINVDFLAKQSVSAISTVSKDFGGGNTTVTRLTVSNASAYAVGDAVKVISRDQIPWLNPVESQMMGSSHTVGAIDVGNNYVFLLDTVYHAFATSIKVAKYNKDVTVNIGGNAVFTKGAGHTGNTRRETISIVGAYRPVVNGMRGDDLNGEFITFTGCYGASAKNIHAEQLLTDSVNDQYGYVVIERSCAYSVHKNLSGKQVRHVYTNGASFNPEVDDFAYYGCNEFAKVYDTVGINCTSSADDTHPESYHTTFYNTVSYSPYRGQDGAIWATQLRGVGDLSINAAAYGGDGIVIRSEYDQDGATKDCAIRGFNYYPKVGETITGAVRVLGRALGRITGVEIEDIKINGAAPSVSVVNIEHADVKLINPHSKATLNNASSMPFYRVEDGTLEIDGGYTDFTGSAQTNLRVSTLVDADSNIIVKNHDIKIGGASVAVLTDFSSSNGNAFFADINMDAAPSFANPSANRGASAVFNATWKINNGLGGRKNYIELSKSANFSLSGNRIEENTSDDVFVVITTTGAAGTINLTDIPLGRLQGQKMLIVNHTDSTKTIQIQKAGNIGISAAKDLLAGDGKTLIWSGVKWMG